MSWEYVLEVWVCVLCFTSFFFVVFFFLGLYSLCQGFLFIRSSFRSLFFTYSFRCVGLECGLGVWVCVWVGGVGWECGLGVCGLGECGLGVYGLGVWVKVVVFNFFFSSSFLGLSSLCQSLLFIRPSLWVRVVMFNFFFFRLLFFRFIFSLSKSYVFL
ncbi:hypothetical protein C1646_156660 [Rhizophagus diaphanus]|nr:hypothetical protein C1646_156660 [Rhizophagus diaphanus] [Rhizophagus sp. MUCL 43196]